MAEGEALSNTFTDADADFAARVLNSDNLGEAFIKYGGDSCTQDN